MMMLIIIELNLLWYIQVKAKPRKKVHLLVLFVRYNNHFTKAHHAFQSFIRKSELKFELERER